MYNNLQGPISLTMKNDSHKWCQTRVILLYNNKVAILIYLIGNLLLSVIILTGAFGLSLESLFVCLSFLISTTLY